MGSVDGVWGGVDTWEKAVEFQTRHWLTTMATERGGTLQKVEAKHPIPRIANSDIEGWTATRVVLRWKIYTPAPNWLEPQSTWDAMHRKRMNSSSMWICLPRSPGGWKRYLGMPTAPLLVFGYISGWFLNGWHVMAWIVGVGVMGLGLLEFVLSGDLLGNVIA